MNLMDILTSENGDKIIDEVCSKIEKIDSSIWNDPEIIVEVEIVYK